MSDINKLDPKLIQHLELMHGDMEAALQSLPDFGFNNQTQLNEIQSAQGVLNELRMTLQYYIYTHNVYYENFEKLLNLLKEAGVSQCVDDLITVRRNVRKNATNYAGTASANDVDKALSVN